MPVALHLDVAATNTGCMERFEGMENLGLGPWAGLFCLLAFGRSAAIEAAQRMSKKG